MIIGGSFNGTDLRVAASLEAKGPEILQRVVLRMNAAAIMLQQHIVLNKLQGQVLKHRTGKLAASIRVINAVLQGSEITAQVQGGGGPAWYGRLHEYGTNAWYFIRPVNKKALAFNIGGTQVIVKSVMHPPIAQRSFMRSGLADLRERIRLMLQDAINEGARSDV